MKLTQNIQEILFTESSIAVCVMMRVFFFFVLAQLFEDKTTYLPFPLYKFQEEQYLNPTTDAESTSTGEFRRQGIVTVATIIPVQGDNSCDEWGGLLPEIQEPTYGATENHPRPVGAPLSVPLQAVGVGEVVVQASESGARGGWR